MYVGMHPTVVTSWGTTNTRRHQLLLNAIDDDASWETGEVIDDNNDLDDANDDNDESSIDDDESSIDETSLVRQTHAAWCQAVDKALTGLERKKASLQSELQKAQNVEKTVARGQLIVSNLYLFNNDRLTKQVTVQDWDNGGADIELILDPQYDSASAEADALFAQARKLKRGTLIIGDLMDEVLGAIQILEDAKLDWHRVLGRLVTTTQKAIMMTT